MQSAPTRVPYKSATVEKIPAFIDACPFSDLEGRRSNMLTFPKGPCRPRSLGCGAQGCTPTARCNEAGKRKPLFHQDAGDGIPRAGEWMRRLSLPFVAGPLDANGRGGDGKSRQDGQERQPPGPSCDAAQCILNGEHGGRHQNRQRDGHHVAQKKQRDRDDVNQQVAAVRMGRMIIRPLPGGEGTNSHNGHYRIRTGDRRVKSPLLYLTKLSAQVGRPCDFGPLQKANGPFRRSPIR